MEQVEKVYLLNDKSPMLATLHNHKQRVVQVTSGPAVDSCMLSREAPVKMLKHSSAEAK